MMDNPDILLNPTFQTEAAKRVVKTNKKWAKIIGINQAARTTCIKPSGTASLVLGSASGIHPHHARKYFRRVQVNKLDPVYKHFKKTNPHMCEESVWSANHTDDVVIFPVVVFDSAMIKPDLSALKHLEIIKSTQKHWVLSGTSDVNKRDVSHNVSCTVIVGKDEWEEVAKYIYENQKFFSAVSFLSKNGDKDYKQAPLEAITTPEDEELWYKIITDFKAVDYTQLMEDEDHTALQQEMVCAGGQCELPILSN